MKRYNFFELLKFVFRIVEFWDLFQSGEDTGDKIEYETWCFPRIWNFEDPSRGDKVWDERKKVVPRRSTWCWLLQRVLNMKNFFLDRILTFFWIRIMNFVFFQNHTNLKTWFLWFLSLFYSLNRVCILFTMLRKILYMKLTKSKKQRFLTLQTQKQEKFNK